MKNSPSKIHLELGSVSVTGTALSSKRESKIEEELASVRAMASSLETQSSMIQLDGQDSLPFRLRGKMKTYRSIRQQEAERKKRG